MDISLVIPVVQLKMASDLFNCIEKNTRKPDEVIIIDNSDSEFKCRLQCCKNIYIKNDPPLRTNDSWKLGFDKSSSTDIITVLNDDLLINKFFFDKLERAVKKAPQEAVIFCPATTGKSKVENAPNSPNRLKKMSKREGWAYTIRRSFLEWMPPIPDELKTFYADDWMWFHAERRNKYWMKMIDNPIFHYRSVSVNQKHLTGHIGREFGIFKDRIKQWQ